MSADTGVDAARPIAFHTASMRALDPTSAATGLPLLPAPLPPTATDHSVRTYVGFRNAFNKEVTLTTGVEYLQSLVTAENARVNVDALLAAPFRHRQIAVQHALHILLQLRQFPLFVERLLRHPARHQ